MKISNYATVFLLVILAFVLNLDVREGVHELATTQKMQYNRAIDTAIDDTVTQLVEMVDTTGTFSLEEVSRRYFKSLYTGFGALDNRMLQETLRAYTPVVCVADTDGFYVLYHSMGESGITQQWSEKKPYVWDAPGYVVNFTMTGELTMLMDGLPYVYTGKAETLLEKYPERDAFTGKRNAAGAALHDVWKYTVLGDAETLENTRRSALTNAIVQEINYYVNQHNRVAEKYGIQHTFTLPQSFADTAARAVDDVSVLVVFEGYPLAGNSAQVYSKFSVGGARLHKARGYYMAKASTGYWYYHKAHCTLRGSSDRYVATRKEAAEMGAFPCPYCRP